MKDILTSVNPKQCWQIVNGIQTIDVRKTKPKLNTPFKVLIYCTKPSKKYQTVARPMVLNDDELFKLPNGEIKYGNSIELVAYDNYSEDNFLNGKVIGEYICDKITSFSFDTYYHTLTHRHGGYNVSLGEFSEQELYSKSCWSFADIYEYIGEHYGYAWHISNLKIYDEPKELSEFKKINRKCWYADLGLTKRDCSKCKDENCLVSRPPQSWCYVESIVYCKNCKYLMFSDCYAECGKGYRGIVGINDFCVEGELK